MAKTRLTGLLTRVSPTPIFFALIGRLLDLLSTMLALSVVPYAFEANPLGLGLTYLFITILMFTLIFAIQLAGLYFGGKCVKIGVYGAYLIALITYIPVINNLLIIHQWLFGA